jgi:hypothetical protein
MHYYKAVNETLHDETETIPVPRRSKNVLRSPRDVRDRDQNPVKTETRPRRSKKRLETETFETETTSLLNKYSQSIILMHVSQPRQHLFLVLVAGWPVVVYLSGLNILSLCDSNPYFASPNLARLRLPKNWSLLILM